MNNFRLMFCGDGKLIGIESDTVKMKFEGRFESQELKKVYCLALISKLRGE